MKCRSTRGVAWKMVPATGTYLSEDFAVMPFQGFAIGIVFRVPEQQDGAARILFKGLVPAGANRCWRGDDRILWRKRNSAGIEQTMMQGTWRKSIAYLVMIATTGPVPLDMRCIQRHRRAMKANREVAYGATFVIGIQSRP